jgi:D-xylose transport system substrate-binding protein
MSKKLFGAVAGLAAASLLVAACGSSSSSDSSSAAPAESSAAPAESSAAPAESESAMAAGGKACVILPDSCILRPLGDRRPAVPRPRPSPQRASTVRHPERRRRQGQVRHHLLTGMLASGVSASMHDRQPRQPVRRGRASQEGRRCQGVPDSRLRPPDPGRKFAKYYVSFDNVAVGTTIGEGLVTCLHRRTATTERPRRTAERLAHRQQRHAVQAGLPGRHRGQAGYDRSPPTRPCPTGTTPRPAPSSSRCTHEANGDFVGVAAANDGLGGAD